MSTRTRATIQDLYKIPDNGKAEIINGEVVQIPPSGGMPGRASGGVALSLHSYERERGGGYAFGDNVWDVDLLNDDVIKVYRFTDPETPTIYKRGDIAEAEPAVPGWTMPVDALFD